MSNIFVHMSDATAAAAAAPSFGSLVVNVVSSEMLNLALRAKFLWIMKGRRIKYVQPCLCGVALGMLVLERHQFVGSFLMGSFLLLLGFWNARWLLVQLPHLFKNGAAAAAGTSPLLLPAAELVASYNLSQCCRKLQIIYGSAFLFMVCWSNKLEWYRRAFLATFLAAVLFRDLGIMAMRYAMDPVSVMQRGSVRGRVLLIMIHLQDELCCQERDLIMSNNRWEALVLTSRTESDVSRHIHLTALKHLADKWLARIAVSLFTTVMRMNMVEHSIFGAAAADDEEEEEEDENEGGEEGEAAAASERTPETRCVSWLRARGSRIADVWWGTETDVCTVCLCALGDGHSSVASFPCAVEKEGNVHRHVFHTKCLCEWLTARRKSQRTCPLCRSAAAEPVQ